MPDSFAVLLMRAQSKANLETCELARRMEVSPSVLYRLQEGVTLPHYQTLIKLSKALGVSTDYLCGLESV